MEQSVPKRRHIKFRRRGNTQKKAHNNENIVRIKNYCQDTASGNWQHQSEADGSSKQYSVFWLSASRKQFLFLDLGRLINNSHCRNTLNFCLQLSQDDRKFTFTYVRAEYAGDS